MLCLEAKTLRKIVYSKLYELGHGNRRGQQKHPRHVIQVSEVLQRGGVLTGEAPRWGGRSLGGEAARAFPDVEA